MKQMDTHAVQFVGVFDSPDEDRHFFQDFSFGRPDPENAESRLDREAGYYIKFVNSIDKPSLNIIDLGGGLGGHYLTLKEYTAKEFNYHIVEIPNAFTMVDDKVKYYSSVDIASADFSDEIDCLYSNATIFLTKGKSAEEHLHDFCKTSANHILLQRTIVCEGEDYNHFYTYNPTGQTYYSITSEKNMIDICESYGYEVSYIEPIYTKFTVHGAPSNLGVVCYKDYLFRKKV